MNKFRCITILLLIILSINIAAKANISDSIPGRNFGFKNSFGPIYALNIIGNNLGVQYERFLDKKNVFALKSGIYYGWYNNGHQYDYINESAVFQTGIKIYPGVLGKTIQFATGIDINYATGEIYKYQVKHSIHRDGLSLILHIDMILNLDKNVYFFFSYGSGVFFSSVLQNEFLSTQKTHTLSNHQLAAGMRFRF
jgi:hypothetical protein